MIVQAILTESVKTDIRDTTTQAVDNLLEQQKRQVSVPRGQSFKTEFNFAPALLLLYDLTPKVIFDLAPLENDGSGFLRQALSDPDYPAPNFDLLTIFKTTSLSTDLDFATITKMKLVFFGSFYIKQYATNFGSDFSFDMYVSLMEPVGALYGYNRLLKVKMGTITYTTSSNTFSVLSVNKVIDLSILINTQDFTTSEGLQLTSFQYNSLFQTNLKIAPVFGFDVSSLGSSQKNYLSLRQKQNNISLGLEYVGTSKQTIAIEARSSIAI